MDEPGESTDGPTRPGVLTPSSNPVLEPVLAAMAARVDEITLERLPVPGDGNLARQERTRPVRAPKSGRNCCGASPEREARPLATSRGRGTRAHRWSAGKHRLGCATANISVEDGPWLGEQLASLAYRP